MRTDIYTIGEVKKKYSDDHKKDSYIKLASKVAFLLEAQDGRYTMPGIQLLGNKIILTLFDHGGSISTHPLDIHQFPEEFLHILLRVTFVTIFFLHHMFFLISVVHCPYFRFAPLHEETDSYLLAFPPHCDSFIVPL